MKVKIELTANCGEPSSHFCRTVFVMLKLMGLRPTAYVGEHELPTISGEWWTRLEFSVDELPEANVDPVYAALMTYGTHRAENYLSFYPSPQFNGGHKELPTLEEIKKQMKEQKS